MRKLLLAGAVLWLAGCAHAVRQPTNNTDIVYSIPERERKALAWAGEGCDGLDQCRARVRELDAARQRPPSSLRLYEAACGQGDGYSCWALSDFARQGIPGGRKEAFTAAHVEALEGECVGGQESACYALGRIHRYGLLGKTDAGKAYGYFLQGCALGAGLACVEQGDLHGIGWGTDKSWQKALALFASRCRGEHNEGCFNIGFLFLGAYEGETEKAADTALVYFRKACAGGDPHGCSSIGWHYDNGEALEASEERALEHFDLACREGHGDGCRNGGRIRLTREQEAEQARGEELLKRGCFELGDTGSCWQLAGWLEVRSAGEALPAYTQACEHGDQESCAWLRTAHEAGRIERLPASASEPACCENAPPPAPVVTGKCGVVPGFKAPQLLDAPIEKP